MEFRFRQFAIDDHGCGMKVGTDSVLLGSWASFPTDGMIVDVGAGSGLLSLMSAQQSPGARILALEIDVPASTAARRNFDLSPWADRLSILTCDALAYRCDVKADMIISNPPYFTSELVSPDAQRATARHANGRLGPLAVLDFAVENLKADGTLAMVTPADAADELLFQAEMRHLKLWRQCMVKTVARKPPTRVLWQFAITDRKPQISSLSIRAGGEYTPEYVELTRDFYLYLK